MIVDYLISSHDENEINWNVVTLATTISFLIKALGYFNDLSPKDEAKEVDFQSLILASFSISYTVQRNSFFILWASKGIPKGYLKLLIWIEFLFL